MANHPHDRQRRALPGPTPRASIFGSCGLELSVPDKHLYTPLTKFVAARRERRTAFPESRHGEALGAVALTALLYWIPALLIGGTCMFLRWRGWFTEPRAGTA